MSNFVTKNLAAWQHAGFISDMKIETGKENEGPIRTMGWTHWHHLHNPRQLLQIALILRAFARLDLGGAGTIAIAKIADRLARNNRWDPSGEKAQSCFDNQALTTGFNYACRGWIYTKGLLEQKFPAMVLRGGKDIECISATDVQHACDYWITDPPYADAVRYEEITEFFIAWLRRKSVRAFQKVDMGLTQASRDQR